MVRGTAGRIGKCRYLFDLKGFAKYADDIGLN